MPAKKELGSANLGIQHLPRLVVFVLCDDPDLGQNLFSVLEVLTGVSVAKSMPLSSHPDDIVRTLRVYAPNVVFLHMQDLDVSARVLTVLRDQISGLKVVGIHSECRADLLLQVLRLGIQDFLERPFSEASVAECCERMRFELMQAPPRVAATDLVYSFLPSKAGVGASTIAANCSIIAAQNANGRVFLGDFDLNSGILRFMLRLSTPYSIVDAVKRGTSMDATQWGQLVDTRGNLDIVHSGNIDLDTRIEAAEVRNLLEFTRRTYRMVCADLSGNLEKYSLEIMRESKLVFLVTTPELPALHLAREKVRLLESIDLLDRVVVLVNRFGKRQLMSASDIETTVGAPVLATLPNDYMHLHSAIQNGTAVDRSSPLGMQYWGLANRMLAAEPVAKKPRKRFLEYFALTPVKYNLE